MILNPGSAVALQCAPSPGYNQLSAPQISSLLVGSLACYPTSPPYEDQEALVGGKIIDYKKGTKDPIDPTATIGTYTVSDGVNPTITYSYTNGASLIYSVWGVTTSGSGQYDFCSGSSPIPIRVVAGSAGPC